MLQRVQILHSNHKICDVIKNYIILLQCLHLAYLYIMLIARARTNAQKHALLQNKKNS